MAGFTVALLACALVGSCAAPAQTNTQDLPWWTPAVGATFQIQYSGKIDLSLDVDVYNLDWEATTAEQVSELSDRGIPTICYLNAGASEDWRSDADAFPESVMGHDLDGWRGEQWLDVRKVDTLLPIMTARMDVCKDKGFVAIDPDNTDGWTQDTGFAISAKDQIAYQKALAAEAHARGLAIGLKNNPDQLDELAEVVDFAVNEECVRYRECGKYADFLDSGKAVFNIEYTGVFPALCLGRPEGMSTVLKDLELSASRKAC